MITVQNIGQMLQLLESNYGQKFYDGVPKENVIRLWASQFQDDDPRAVLQGVQNCINTMTYKPTIADIRKRMAQAKMGGQMTSIEAFQQITDAVRMSHDRDSSITAFNALAPILRKVVGKPQILRDWHNVPTESYHTVIMSAIRESYRELAQREFDFYALPKPLQTAESWRIDAPDQAALPEPEVQKTIEEIVTEANEKASEHGMTMTPELQQKHSSRVGAFLAPMTAEEKKLVEMRENRKAEWSLK